MASDDHQLKPGRDSHKVPSPNYFGLDLPSNGEGRRHVCKFSCYLYMRLAITYAGDNVQVRGADLMALEGRQQPGKVWQCQNEAKTSNGSSQGKSASARRLNAYFRQLCSVHGRPVIEPLSPIGSPSATQPSPWNAMNVQGQSPSSQMSGNTSANGRMQAPNFTSNSLHIIDKRTTGIIDQVKHTLADSAPQTPEPNSAEQAKSGAFGAV